MKRSLVVLIVLTAASCDQKPPTDAGPSHTATTTTEVAPPEVPDVEVADALPAEEVTALFNTWLQSQNDQNFEAYSKLFADGFEGVRRTGPRLYRFDRAGWLKDRQRMFEKPMKVEATDVEIATAELSATVLFQQTWSSGGYTDAGPKRLLIVKEGGELRIAREELLASDIDGSADAPTYHPDKFALVVDGRVLLDLAPKRGWESGAPELVQRPNVARKAAENTGFEEWVGRELQLFAADGATCAATVDRLDLVVRVIPHFGTVQTWDGGLTGDGRKYSDAEVAAELWRFGSEFDRRVALFATLKPNDCDGALWARSTGDAAPIAEVALADNAQQQVMDQFTDLPGFHTTQEDFNAWGHHGAWHIEGATRAVRAFGDWRFASAIVNGPCGAFSGALWGLWTSKDDALTLASSEDGMSYFDARAALSHGDAVYFLDGTRALGLTPSGWRVLWDASPLDLDCYC